MSTHMQSWSLNGKQLMPTPIFLTLFSPHVSLKPDFVCQKGKVYTYLRPIKYNDNNLTKTAKFKNMEINFRHPLSLCLLRIMTSLKS